MMRASYNFALALLLYLLSKLLIQSRKGWHRREGEEKQKIKKIKKKNESKLRRRKTKKRTLIAVRICRASTPPSGPNQLLASETLTLAKPAHTSCNCFANGHSSLQNLRIAFNRVSTHRCLLLSIIFRRPVTPFSEDLVHVRMASAVDAWSDNWEALADKESAEAKKAGSESNGEASSTLGQSVTAPKAPTLLLKKVPVEEENRKIWAAAEAANPFEVLPSASAPPNKVIQYKPELKILKRAPPKAPEPATNTSVSDSPAVIDRKERERRYAEARERLFGPSTTASNEGTPSASNTPSAGMSRSSSATGLASKSTEGGSGTNTPSKERGGGNSGRGGKKGGRGGTNSGNSTPRNKSPGNGEKREKGGDLNRTSGIVGGITKVTENGWVYTGTGQGLAASPGAKLSADRADPRTLSTGVATLSSGMMAMGLSGPGVYNPQGNPYTGAPGGVGMWGMGVTGSGAYLPGQNTLDPSRQRTPVGFHLQQFYPHNHGYQSPQPPPPFPQYKGPMQFNPQTQPFHKQAQMPYQTAGSNMPFSLPQQQPQHNFTPYANYNRQSSQSTPSGSSTLTPSLSHPSQHESNGSTGARTVYLQDPNAFTTRPPPPQGSLVPGLGNHAGPGEGASGEQLPIRTPRGPDLNMGRGFAGRGGRGPGGF